MAKAMMLGGQLNSPAHRKALKRPLEVTYTFARVLERAGVSPATYREVKQRSTTPLSLPRYGDQRPRKGASMTQEETTAVKAALREFSDLTLTVAATEDSIFRSPAICEIERREWVREIEIAV